jgi:hypothetical protein
VTESHGQTAKFALDGQTFATLGAACVDHSAATTGFHANQKAVGTGATCLGWLIGAFHYSSFVPKDINLLLAKPKIIANFRRVGKYDLIEAFGKPLDRNLKVVVYDAHPHSFWHVDKLLINQISLPFFLSTVHKKINTTCLMDFPQNFRWIQPRLCGRLA